MSFTRCCTRAKTESRSATGKAYRVARQERIVLVCARTMFAAACREARKHLRVRVDSPPECARRPPRCCCASSRSAYRGARARRTCADEVCSRIARTGRRRCRRARSFDGRKSARIFLALDATTVPQCESIGARIRRPRPVACKSGDPPAQTRWPQVDDRARRHASTPAPVFRCPRQAMASPRRAVGRCRGVCVGCRGRWRACG